MARKQFCVNDIIGFVCNENELEDMNESDDSDLEEFDGYIDENEMEILMQKGNDEYTRNECSDDDDVCSAVDEGNKETSTCNAIEDMEWTVDDRPDDTSAQPQLVSSSPLPYISETLATNSSLPNTIDSPTSSDQLLTTTSESNLDTAATPSTSDHHDSSTSFNASPVGKCTVNMHNKSPLDFFKLLVT